MKTESDVSNTETHYFKVLHTLLLTQCTFNSIPQVVHIGITAKLSFQNTGAIELTLTEVNG